MTPWPSRAAVTLGQVAVTAGLLWLIFGSVGAGEVMQTLFRLDPKMLILAIVVLLMQFAVMAWRWKILLQLLFGKAVPFGTLALSLGQGMLASQALPATVGGDAYRMALVADRVGAAAAVRSVICDRVLALASLITLVLILAPFTAGRFGATPAVLSLIAACTLALTAFGAMLVLGPAIEGAPVIGKSLAAVTDDARRALFGGERAILASSLGLITHLCGALLVYCLALSTDAALAPLDCLLIVPPILLVSALPISLGGWGVREGAFFAGFSMAGADPAAGVTVSILFGASGILLGAAAGLIAPFANVRDARRRKS